MNLDRYQRLTEKTASYPIGEEVQYLTIGLCGETGEVADKVKKWRRERDEAYLEDVEDELGDVLWYMARLADELDCSLAEIAERNLAKTQDRQNRDQITGEGDNR